MNHTSHLANDLIIRSLLSKIEKLSDRVAKLEKQRQPSSRPSRHFSAMPVPPDQAAAASKILDRAARINGTTIMQICGSRGNRRVCLARAEAAYECQRAGLSSPVIGRVLGNRDHSTILHLIGRHKVRLDGINQRGAGQ